MFTSLPLLPPPPSTLLPSHTSSFAPTYATESSTITNGNPPLNHVQQQQAQQRRAKPPHSSSRGNTLSLAALSMDEKLTGARKQAIAMYGYGWLRPAGCAKTMLGRKEEEAEREEVERQLREVEEQEAMALAGEEELRRQAVLERGEVQEEGERDLDEEIPDADAFGENGENGMDEERDMDDDVPEADDMDRTNLTFGTTTTGLMEGETGITDDVEVTNLGEPGQATSNSFREFEAEEQAALADAMLDEDEQGMAERDLDDDIPEGHGTSGMEERDLDDDVPEADDGEGEWQHTDTEDEGLDEDDEGGAGMDISNLDQSGMAPMHGITPGQNLGSSAGHTPDAIGSTDSGRRWFSGGARRNLFGRGAGNLFGITPPQQLQQEEATDSGAPRRRSGRRGFGRENRARDSLD